MNQFKALLLAGGMFAAVGTSSAFAAPALSFEVVENGVIVISPTSPGANSTTGSLSGSGSDNIFSTLSVNITGAPLKAQPGLVVQEGLTTKTGIAAGTVNSLTVFITQTGLTSPTGFAPLQDTIDLNNLGGGVASAVRDYIDVNNGAFAETTLIAPQQGGTPGTDSTNGTGGTIQSINFGAGPFSETLELDANFTGGGVSLTSSNQLITPAVVVTVPEPTSIALIGTALFGFGLIRRRRNRS